MFNFRCPDDLLEAIAARAKVLGESQSKVVVDALRDALGLLEQPSTSYASMADLAELRGEVEELAGKLKAS
jgi:hypothetical protein